MNFVVNINLQFLSSNILRLTSMFRDAEITKILFIESKHNDRIKWSASAMAPNSKFGIKIKCSGNVFLQPLIGL